MSTVAQDQCSEVAERTGVWRVKLGEVAIIKRQLEEKLAFFVGCLVQVTFTSVYGAVRIQGRQLGEREWKPLSDDVPHRMPFVGFVKDYELDDQGHAYLIIARLKSTQELRVDVEDVDHFDIEILEPF